MEGETDSLQWSKVARGQCIELDVYLPNFLLRLVQIYFNSWNLIYLLICAKQYGETKSN